MGDIVEYITTFSRIKKEKLQVEYVFVDGSGKVQGEEYERGKDTNNGK